jgi:hypothetical protein
MKMECKKCYYQLDDNALSCPRCNEPTRLMGKNQSGAYTDSTLPDVEMVSRDKFLFAMSLSMMAVGIPVFVFNFLGILLTFSAGTYTPNDIHLYISVISLSGISTVAGFLGMGKASGRVRRLLAMTSGILSALIAVIIIVLFENVLNMGIIFLIVALTFCVASLRDHKARGAGN